MFDPRCLLKWPFWLLHAPLVSAANAKKVSVWWKTSLSYSLQDSCCKRLENSKFVANLIHAMDLPKSAKLSWAYLKRYLARKSETQNTCKQTVKYLPWQHERFTHRTIKLISVKDKDQIMMYFPTCNLLVLWVTDPFIWLSQKLWNNLLSIRNIFL